MDLGYILKEESTRISGFSWMCERKRKRGIKNDSKIFYEKTKGRMETPSAQMAKAADRAGWGDESDQFWIC